MSWSENKSAYRPDRSQRRSNTTGIDRVDLACAMMDQSAFSARAQRFQEQQSPARKKTKQPTNMFGGVKHGTRKSSGDSGPVNRQCTLALNQMHRHQLDQAHYHIMNAHNHQIATNKLCDLMVETFNGWHNYWVSNGRPGGFGGLITGKLVKQHLKDKGNQVVGFQLQHRMQESRPPAPTIYNPPIDHPDLTPLTVGQVNQLTCNQCRKVLRALTTSQQGDTATMKSRIKQAHGMP